MEVSSTQEQENVDKALLSLTQIIATGTQLDPATSSLSSTFVLPSITSMATSRAMLSQSMLVSDMLPDKQSLEFYTSDDVLNYLKPPGQGCTGNINALLNSMKDAEAPDVNIGLNRVENIIDSLKTEEARAATVKYLQGLSTRNAFSGMGNDLIGIIGNSASSAFNIPIPTDGLSPLSTMFDNSIGDIVTSMDGINVFSPMITSVLRIGLKLAAHKIQTDLRKPTLSYGPVIAELKRVGKLIRSGKM